MNSLKAGLLRGALAAAALALLAAPGTAGATTFTINSPINITGGGLDITINKVTSLSGTQICLDDTGGGCTGDILVFTVTVNTGSDPLAEIEANDFAGNAAKTLTGVGQFTGTGADPNSVDLLPAGCESGTPNCEKGKFVFSPVLTAGTTTDILFVSYSSLTTPGAASFMALEEGSAVVFSGQTGTEEIPEPQIALLLLAGVAGLAFAGRPRRC
jgi:hypothetical protein